MIKSQIYFGDCLDFIKELPDNCIDVCLTDPPYGIDFQSNRKYDKNEYKSKIANDQVPFTDWIKPLFLKMKDGGRLLCFYRWDVQDSFLNEILEAGFTVKSQIIWDKVVHGMGDLKGEFSPQHESIIYATKGRYEFNGKRPTTLYRVQRVAPGKLIHPNQKPTELIKRLIQDISSPNEVIFDPFGGSMVTYIEADKLDRVCLTCELSQEYYEIGLNNVQRNTFKNKIF